MSAMGSVWKRLQRVNKRAAKFQFTASYHELRVATTPKWRPSNLSVVWTRRSRRVSSTPLPWEPDMMNPLVGNVSWPVPDNHVITVTLFKDPRTHEMEDKNWTFVLEDITPLGKKRVLANASINMRQYASIQSTQQTFVLNLKPVSRKITAVDLELTISCVFLMEGKATDEDMQSVVSLMSVTNNCDVAPLEDLEYIKESENPIDLHDITNQLEQLTTNLNGGTNLPTPLSIPSLSEDMTPLAETNNLNFDKEPNGDGYAKTNSKNVSESQELARISLDDALKTPSANIIASSVTTSVTTPTTSITTTTAQQEGKHKKTECGFRMQRDGYCNIVFTSTPTNNEGSVIKNNESLSMLGMNTTDFISLIIKEEEEQSRRRKLGLESLITFDKFVFTSIRTMHTTSSTTTSVKRPALQPLNLKKSYESIDSDHIQIQGVNNVSNAITTSTSTSTSTTTTTTMPNVQSLPNGHLNMSTCKPIEKIILKENTPGQDLLEWCKEITKDYPNIMVTNLTTSWRNGMAFCAIIHHYKPHLIDMSELKPENVENNCRLAFDTAESLGIPRVIAPSDMKLLKVPDKLAVITYLYQLRSHFTGEQLEIELIGSTSDESSYVIGNYKTDNLSSQNLLNLSHLKAHLLHQNSIEDDICSITDETPQISPTAKKDVKNLPKNSKTILGKELSPTKDKNYMNTSSATPLTKTPSSPIIEDNHYANIDLNKDTKENFEKGKYVQNSIQEVQSNSVAMTSSKTALDPLKTNKILSRHKEQSDKARIMMEKLKKTQVDKNMYDEERQQRLREQARRLILETRNKLSDSSRPTSPTKITSTTSILTTAKSNTTATTNYYNNTMDHNNLLSYTITNSSITDDKCCVQSGSTITTTLIDEVPKTTTTATATKILITPTKKYNTFTCDNDNTIINNNCSDDSNKSNHPTLSSHRLSEDLLNGTTPLQSFNAVMDRISPKNEKKLDKLSYIESELEALEREQEAIDKKARNLEKKLRAVMGGNPSNKRSSSRNPFIKLLRNSIRGGGETIRIKLLDLEKDEFSLANSSDNSDTSTSSSSISEDEARVKRRRQPHQQQQFAPLCHNDKEEEQLHNKTPIPPPRTHRIRKQCSKSCFIESTKEHHHHANNSSQIHTVTTLNTNSQPYTLLSSNSSNPSSCDNFEICSDEDGNVPLKVKRRHRRHRNNYSRHHHTKKHNKLNSGGNAGGGETEETEEQLLSQWFTLVNKKNALLRRQMQLNILEQEDDLERKYAMLIQELRAAQSVEDWRKTEPQREKEKLLLEDVIAIVNKRNELVQRLHNEEIAIEDDHEIARELEQVDIRAGKEKCIIQ